MLLQSPGCGLLWNPTYFQNLLVLEHYQCGCIKAVQRSLTQCTEDKFLKCLHWRDCYDVVDPGIMAYDIGAMVYAIKIV